jgi:outer membrane protein TolC
LSKEPLMRLVPVLGLTAQGRVTNEGGFVGRSIDGFIGLDVSWALFDGGDRYGDRNERDANARIAALNERLRTRGVALEVDNALVMLRMARDTDTQSQVAVSAAARNAQETSELYRQGLTTAFQLADATQRQFEADVAQVRARYAVLMALLDLRAALGVDPLGREVQP